MADPVDLRPIPPPDWRAELICDDKTGRPKPRLLTNITLMLKCHPEMEGVLAWNEMHYAPFLVRRPFWETKPAEWVDRRIEDHDLAPIFQWLESKAMMPTKDNIRLAIGAAAWEFRYHPIKEYLSSLVWDGVPRLSGRLIAADGSALEPDEIIRPFASEYLNSGSHFIHNIFAKRWFVSGVARIAQPGCKVDCMIVLEGPQGYMKSSFLRELAQIDGVDYFLDHLRDMEQRDTILDMAGKWIVEVAELASFGRKEEAQIKSFLSRSVDTFRSPWGTYSDDHKRQCILAGTINPTPAGYLRDPTGARRFWPIPVGKPIDMERIAEDRDQLWAEAVELYRQREIWWLTETEIPYHAEVAGLRNELEPLWWRIEEIITEAGYRMTTGDIMKKMFVGVQNETPIMARRIISALQMNGWRSEQVTENGKRRSIWVPKKEKK